MRALITLFGLSFFGFLGYSNMVAAQEVVPVVRRDTLPISDLNNAVQIGIPKDLERKFPQILTNIELPTQPLDRMGIKLRPPYVSVLPIPNPSISLYGTAFEGFNYSGQPIAVHDIRKSLHFDYRLTNSLKFSASGSIGYSSLPLTIAPYQLYNISAGLTHRVGDRLTVGGGVSGGRMVESSYINPSMYMQYNLTPNLQAMLYGGMYSATPPHQSTYNSRAAYGGLQLTYTMDNGLFVYGKGFLSHNNGLYPGFVHQPYAYSSGFGAGLGYVLPGGSPPISIGVDWVTNPYTGQISPVAQINLYGGLLYLLKLLTGSLERDGSYSSSGRNKRPLQIISPLSSDYHPTPDAMRYRRPLEVAHPKNVMPIR